MIDADVLLRCAVAPHNAAKWGDVLDAAARRWSINTNLRQAHWLAQILHESAMLSSVDENLNYSVAGILGTWTRKQFPARLAHRYGRIDGVRRADVEMIANVAYANRLGNGGIESGDGYRYRGRGPIQITGLDNYRDCGEAIGIDLVSHPDMLLIPAYGAMAAGWFWSMRGASRWADEDDVRRVSITVNGQAEDGEPNGLRDRMKLARATLAAIT